MQDEYISALEVTKKHKLFLKVVTSVTTFDNYNSFFNIYDQSEEPCRRIVVLTPYKELEEVYDTNPNEEINPMAIVDGNLWIREYPLTMNPKDIDIKSIVISREAVKKFIDKIFM